MRPGRLAVLLLLMRPVFADTLNTTANFNKGDRSSAVARGMSFRLTTFDGLTFSNKATGPEGNLRHLSFVSTDGYLMSNDDISVFVGDENNEQGVTANADNFSIGSASSDSQGILDFFYRTEALEMEIARQELWPTNEVSESHLALDTAVLKPDFSLRYGFNGFDALRAHSLALSHSLNIFAFSNSGNYDELKRRYATNHGISFPLLDFRHLRGNFSISTSAGSGEEDFSGYSGSYSARIADFASASCSFSSRDANIPYSASLRLPHEATFSYSASTQESDRTYAFSAPLLSGPVLSLNLSTSELSETRGASLTGSLSQFGYSFGATRTETTGGENTTACTASGSYKVASVSTSWDNAGMYGVSLNLDLRLSKAPAWHEAFLSSENESGRSSAE